MKFKSLPIGKHDLVFEIDDKFFEQFEGSEISKGKLTARLNINRMSDSMLVALDIDGNVVTQCDRCLDDVTLDVEYTSSLLVKYGEAPEEDTDDEIMYIDYGEDEVNFAQYLYDSICLSLPIQRTHANEADCNKDMMERLKKMRIN